MSFAWKIGFGLALAGLSASGPSAAQPREMAPFNAVGVESGGQVVIRPGSTHSVRILSGDPATITITSDHRGLWIRGCDRACPRVDPRLEVIMPEVQALAVHGGGEIRISPGFERQKTLAVAVHGGGRIDTLALQVENVAAAVAGGGEVATRADRTLAAITRGGGVITYSGSPQVTASTEGGGTIRKANTN